MIFNVNDNIDRIDSQTNKAMMPIWDQEYNSSKENF